MKNYLPNIIILTLAFFSCSEKHNQIKEMTAQSEIELMEKTQKDVFKYFWDYSHPNSKLSRERLHENDLSFDQNTITSGGSGFGLLNILMGIENHIITKSDGIDHLETALNFLENTDRFHGAWSHWLNGDNGTVIPFSPLDNGGDIVETAFLCQALICIREYFKEGDLEEQELAEKADKLWREVEWNWYTNNENVLYWHWSPEYDWQMNFSIEGYNECLIAYVLAASSPTYPISDEVYHNGWARNGNIVSEALMYDIPVVFKHNGALNSVGPLFWAHYSFLALDPRGLEDNYTNYWNLVKNHSQIIYQHSVINPNKYNGYSESCWGLTASYSRNLDGSTGYDAHQPNNDKGVITPTAALSSLPFTPEESIKFMRFLYEETEGEYIGIAGPYDAFSPHFDWKTRRYLAIDQGTIGPMIENYKSQLFWNLFMNAPEIRAGLKKLGFSSSQHGI